jgi:hypothetical protein
LLADIPTRREVRAEIVKYYTYASNVNTELVRMERVAASPEAGEEGFYDKQRFLLEAQGRAPNLMRFLARVGSGRYNTFILSNIRISPDGPSTAEADLEIYSSELSADEPLPASTPAATPPSEESSRGPDRDRALKLSDGFHEAVVAGDWKQVVSLGEQFLGLETESEYARMAVYEGHVRVGYDLLADGRAMEAREHFRRALAIVPGGQEAQQGLEAVEAKRPSQDTPDGDAATTMPTGERSSGTEVHVVRRGESLSLLAQRYDTTVQELVQLNDLRHTTIYVGQELLVPAR